MTILLSIAAYLVIGWFCGRYTVPAGIQRSYNYWSDGRATPLHKEFALTAGTGWRFLTLFLWVVAVPLTALLNREDAFGVEKYAPWKQQEKTDRLHKRISELERELQIGGRK